MDFDYREALKSGDVLEADVVITATGFNLSAIGGIPVHIDGTRLDPAETFTYRGIMLSDMPNFAMVFSYLRTSWTMRVDLLGDHLCRLLNYMDAKNSHVVTPRLRPEDEGMGEHRWISEDEFNPGYMNRGAHLMPNSGDHEPWVFSPDYCVEREQMPQFSLEDGVLT